MNTVYYLTTSFYNLYQGSPPIGAIVALGTERIYGKQTYIFTHIRPEPFALICCLALFALAPKGSKARETFKASLIADINSSERNSRNAENNYPKASCDLILVWQRIIEIALMNFPPTPLHPRSSNQVHQKAVEKSQAKSEVKNQGSEKGVDGVNAELNVKLPESQDKLEVKNQGAEQGVDAVNIKLDIQLPEYEKAIRSIYEYAVQGLNVLIVTYTEDGDKAATVQLLRQCVRVIKSGLEGTLPTEPTGGPVDSKITDLSKSIWKTPSDIITIAHHLAKADEILKQNPQKDVKETTETILGIIHLHTAEFTPKICQDLNRSLAYGEDV